MIAHSRRLSLTLVLALASTLLFTSAQPASAQCTRMVGPTASYASISAAVPGAGGREVICVERDPASATVLCPGGTYLDTITVIDAQVHILATSSDICVESAAAAPTVLFDRAGSSSIRGFARWVNNHAAPAIAVRRTHFTATDNATIGSPRDTAVLGLIGAELFLLNNSINDSEIGVHLIANARLAAEHNDVLGNDLGFLLEQGSRADVVRNEIYRNHEIAVINDAHLGHWQDNGIHDNWGGYSQWGVSTVTLHNNLWVDNSLSGQDPLIELNDSSRGTILNNTLDGTVSWANVATNNAASLSLLDSILTNSDGGVSCLSSVAPTLAHDDFFNLAIYDLSGCPISSTHLYADPMFSAGPDTNHYLDPASSLVDAGSIAAGSAFDMGARSYTTDPTHAAADSGTVDLGYHSWF